MPCARPSLALGLSLAALNLAAAVLPPAAHSAAHLHEAEHHGAILEGHHDGHGGGYSHDTDGHLHLVLQAVATKPRPDARAAAVREVAPTALDDLAVRIVMPVADRHARAVIRTHDPPDAPRAPPAT